MNRQKELSASGVLGMDGRCPEQMRSIPGQTSGLSFNYFLILTENTDAVKGDRMVTRFVAEALGRKNIPPEQAEELVREASAILRPDFPNLTPSLLDNKIWKHQRSSEPSSSGNCRA